LLLSIILSIIMIKFWNGGIAVAQCSILNCHLQVLKNVRETTSNLGDESCCPCSKCFQNQFNVILRNGVEQEAIVVRKVTCQLFRIWRCVGPNQIAEGEVLPCQKTELGNVEVLKLLKRFSIK
jgi:hypothetical protein